MDAEKWQIGGAKSKIKYDQITISIDKNSSTVFQECFSICHRQSSLVLKRRHVDGCEVVDALYYMHPGHKEKILKAVAKSVESALARFYEHHPDYKVGAVPNEFITSQGSSPGFF